jgi:hypothetical protein
MSIDLSSVLTCELYWELMKREGITTLEAGVGQPYNITVGTQTIAGEGPAGVMVNID